MIAPRQLIVDPLEHYPVDIGRGLWQLQDARRRLLEFLEKRMPPNLANWMPPQSQMNSIGTLLYHIAAIEMDWLYTEVLQREPPPEVHALFPYDVRDETGKLSVIVGESLADHLSRLQTVRQWLLDEFKSMTLEDFRRTRILPDYEVTPEWVLHHLEQHESEHRGEIMLVAVLASAATET